MNAGFLKKILITISVLVITADAGYAVVGYIQSYEDSTVMKLPLNTLTHILFAFGGATSNGTILNSDLDCIKGGLENPTLLRQLVYLCHENGVLVGLAMGGAKFTGFPSFASSPSTFVSSLRKIIDLYNLDGIDMDWEFPTDASQFHTLMSACKTELSKDNKFLSMAVVGDNSGGNATGQVGAKNDADFINIMAYPNLGTSSCISFWSGQASKSKLTLGVDFATESGKVSSTAQDAVSGGLMGVMAWDIGVPNGPSLLNQVAAKTGAVAHCTFLACYAGVGTVTKSPNKTAFPSSGSVTLTAGAAPTGYKFVGWSGDNTTTGTSITLDMASNKVVSAVYVPTATDSLDFFAGEDLGLIGSPSNSSSTVPAKTLKSNGTYTVPYKLGSGDESWLGITARLPWGSCMIGLTDIKVTYKSDRAMTFCIDQFNSEDGFEFYVEKSTNWRTVVIPKGSFAQPPYVQAPPVLNLAKDSSFTFSPLLCNTVTSFNGTFELKELVFYGVKGLTSIATSAAGRMGYFATCAASFIGGNMKLSLSGFPAGLHTVSVFSIDGRELSSSIKNLNAGQTAIYAKGVSAKGLYLIRVNGPEGTKTFTVNSAK